MSKEWYYVEGTERVGPVDQEQLDQLFTQGALSGDSYVWAKGFDNWEHIKNVSVLSYLLSSPSAVPPTQDIPSAPSSSEVPSFSSIKPIHTDKINFQTVSHDKKIFTIKVGYDRGGSNTEYGPFSLVQLRKAFEENRINDKTYIFAAGMETWVLLGDFELYDKVSDSLPPQIDDSDRRISVRKPFIARLLFHDNKDVYEGICRDISIGGLQVLVSEFPCKVGERVSLNVHPDNSDYHFTASGVVVRKLEGDTGFSMRFKDLSTEAYQAINHYINDN